MRATSIILPSWEARRAKGPEVPDILARTHVRIAEQVRWSHERHAAFKAEQAARPRPRRFRMLRCTEAASLPRPRYLVPGLIVERTIGAFYGPSGSLKSFLLLDIALSLAHGLPWCGHDLPRVPVFYVAAEGAHGLGVRIDAWKRDRGVAGQESLFVLIPEGVNLMDPECIRDLMAEIALMYEGIGLPPALVVLDTLATCAVGMEENSGKETGLAVGAMSEMRHTLGCCVYAVHHTGKDAERGMRGSYRLKGDLDAVIEAERGEGTLHISTFVEKQKDGPDGQARHFTARPVEWWKDGGGIVSTLVLDPREEQVGSDTAEHDRIMEIRMRAASVLELDAPTSRSRLCALAGWSPGRIYGLMDEAFPEGGARVVTAQLGAVRIGREDGRIVMRKE
jgi:hypothetical protein